MIKQTTILFFLFFLLFAPITFAAQEPNYAEVPSLEIIYPKQPYFLYNEIIDLHFPVYNSTNQLQTNISTTCLIHIYNSTGNHMKEENLGFDDNGVDYFIMLNPDEFKWGEYSYLVHCGNGYEYGFVSEGFNIYKSNPDVKEFPLIAIILIPLLFGFLLLIGNSTLSADEHSVIKIFMLILSLLTIPLSYQLGLSIITEYYPDFTSIQDLMGFQVFWITMGLVMLLTYFIIYSFYKMIRTAAEKKEEELRY